MDETAVAFNALIIRLPCVSRESRHKAQDTRH